MYKWDSSSKVLSEKERAYLAEFAWGLKKLNKSIWFMYFDLRSNKIDEII